MFFILSAHNIYVQHFKSFHSIFPQFKVKFDADTPFFQVCHFVGTPKLQAEQNTLVHNKTSLSNHSALFQGGSDSAESEQCKPKLSDQVNIRLVLHNFLLQ
jgi:hypothetical protein